MKWEIDSGLAIYPQIVDGFIKGLVKGELVAGQRLPSIRELASEAAINPNTMQRAMAELERREIVVNQRTTGKFVTENTQILEQVKKEFANRQVSDFLKTMKEMGFSSEDIISIVKDNI